jgi:hypothetical protein
MTIVVLLNPVVVDWQDQHQTTIQNVVPPQDATEPALAAGGASVDDVADQILKKSRIGSERIKYIAKTKITA